MWEPNNVCHRLCRFDKILTSPEQCATSGIFIALVTDGECVAESETAVHAAKGGILFFGGDARLIPIGESCSLSACELSGEAAAGLAQRGARSIDAAAHQLAAQLAARLCEGEGDATAAECFALICALFEASEREQPEIPPLVAAAIAQIRENYSGLYGVEELSANLGVSKSHLIRCFCSAMKKTPGEYLTEVRIDAARQLLSEPDYTLEIIAGLCGFSGANYLCRVFKKHTGSTPAQYRRMAQSGRRPALPQERHMYV